MSPQVANFLLVVKFTKVQPEWLLVVSAEVNRRCCCLNCQLVQCPPQVATSRMYPVLQKDVYIGFTSQRSQLRYELQINFRTRILDAFAITNVGLQLKLYA